MTRIARTRTAFTAAVAEITAVNGGLEEWIDETDLTADPDTAYAMKSLANEIIADADAILDCYADGFGDNRIANKIRRFKGAALATVTFCDEIIGTRNAWKRANAAAAAWA